MEKTPSDSEPYTEFETVLYREIGQYGKYQKYTVLLLLFPALLRAFMAAEYIFTAASLPHRCLVVECDGLQPEYAPNWILNAIPETSTGLNKCYRYANTSYIPEDKAAGTCPAALFDRNNTIPCDSYVYERTNTVVYDFNLECQEWLRALPGTVNGVGGMVCLALAGFISDRFGRRTSMVLFSFNIALFGVIRAFSVNYTMYVLLHFLQTALGGGLFSAVYILGAEIVGPKYRVRTSAILTSMSSFGHMVVGATAYIVTEWRNLTLLLYAPGFLVLSYHWLIAESPRWLLSKNKEHKGRATLERVARMNGNQISEKTTHFLLTAIASQATSKKQTNKENLFKRIIKSPVMLRRCCTTPILWITYVFIYYGISINSVNMSGNMHFNYIATAGMEIPGFWISFLILDRIGRRFALFGGYMICAICCTAFAFTPKSMYVLSLLLYMIGKFCIGSVMMTLYLYTSELYPTQYRHSLLAFSSMIGRLGSVVAPLTPPLMVYWSGTPSIMFATMAFLSSFLVLTQPETRGLKVPDTIEDAENLGKTSSKI